MKSTPGVEDKSFYIQLKHDYFKKGEVIVPQVGFVPCVVIRVYKRTWWRRVLFWCGFKVRMMQVKVSPQT